MAHILPIRPFLTFSPAARAFEPCVASDGPLAHPPRRGAERDHRRRRRLAYPHRDRTHAGLGRFHPAVFWVRPMRAGWTQIGAKLKAQGYATHFVGKGHTGYKSVRHLPIHNGFDTHVGLLGGAGVTYVREPDSNAASAEDRPSHRRIARSSRARSVWRRQMERLGARPQARPAVRIIAVRRLPPAPRRSCPP